MRRFKNKLPGSGHYEILRQLAEMDEVIAQLLEELSGYFPAASKELRALWSTKRRLEDAILAIGENAAQP